jgi:hypothetical protein
MARQRMPWRRIALVTIALAGCRTPQPDTAATGMVMSADSLRLAVSTDKQAYGFGEPIELVLKLTNHSSQPVTLEFPSSQRYDFVIADSSGATVWSWSANRMFAQMIGAERVAPNDSREYREQFSGSLPTGTYRATGIITTIGLGRQVSTTFSVH